MRLGPLSPALLLAVALLTAACGGSEDGQEPVQTPSAADSASATPTATPESAQGLGGCGSDTTTGLSVKTITSGGIARSYRLYVPSSYDASSPMPLVLNFHGLGGSAEQQERGSGFVDIAEREGFVLVSPDGTNDPRRWYIFGDSEPGYVDDFAFVDDLLDEVSATICVDPSRVFATGISNGGGMTSLLACENDRIAAIGPVAGSPYSAPLCRDRGPMPVIAFHGTDDLLVPFAGGSGGRLALLISPVRENMRGWAGHNGCDMTLQTERVSEDVVLERYTNCDEDADVLLYVVEAGGHTWPGATRNRWFLGRTTHTINASELIWSFFASH